MSDLWIAASADPEQEQADRLFSTARMACAPQFAFVAQASSDTEYEDRLAIVAEKVESSIQRVLGDDLGAFPVVHAALLQSWEDDFQALKVHARLSSQERNNKRGFLRNQKRGRGYAKEAGYGTDDGFDDGYGPRPYQGNEPDRHGNVLAQEGVDRCSCGSKYWENDRCVDCGTHVRHKESSRKTAGSEGRWLPADSVGQGDQFFVEHDGETRDGQVWVVYKRSDPGAATLDGPGWGYPQQGPDGQWFYASRKTAGVYEVMMGQGGTGAQAVSFKARKDTYWKTTHFRDKDELEQFLAGQAAMLDMSGMYDTPEEDAEYSDVLVFKFPAAGANSDAYVWQGSLDASPTLAEYSGVKTGGFRRIDRGGWVRDEKGELSNGTPAYTHVTGPDDNSPHHLIYTGYDSDCSWCYLNAPHSEAAHAASIASYTESKRTGSSKTAASPDWSRQNDGAWMLNGRNGDYAWAIDAQNGAEWEIRNSSGARVHGGVEGTMVDAKAQAEYVLKRRESGDRRWASKAGSQASETCGCHAYEGMPGWRTCKMCRSGHPCAKCSPDSPLPPSRKREGSFFAATGPSMADIVAGPFLTREAALRKGSHVVVLGGENPFAKKKDEEKKDDKPEEKKDEAKGDAPAAESAPATGEAPPPDAEAQQPGETAMEGQDDTVETQGGTTDVDPATMTPGQTASMTYNMASGGVSGTIEVTFVRVEGDVYFFNGPTGEFGVGQQGGTWKDATGNTFTFAGKGSADKPGDAAPEEQKDGQPEEKPEQEKPAGDDPNPASDDEAWKKKGAKSEVSVWDEETCWDCGGKGWKLNDPASGRGKTRECTTCEGTGRAIPKKKGKTAAAYGERAACQFCGQDIEHGGKGVWHDRGGQTRCDKYTMGNNGEAGRDENGVLIPNKNEGKPHKPYTTASRKTANSVTITTGVRYAEPGYEPITFTVDIGDAVVSDPEQVWAAASRVYDIPEERGRLKLPWQMKVREALDDNKSPSLSVGDTVKFDGGGQSKTWKVESMGFSEV